VQIQIYYYKYLKNIKIYNRREKVKNVLIQLIQFFSRKKNIISSHGSVANFHLFDFLLLYYRYYLNSVFLYLIKIIFFFPLLYVNNNLCIENINSVSYIVTIFAWHMDTLRFFASTDDAAGEVVKLCIMRVCCWLISMFI
jgi:hypothetical protein